ncbi:MAG: hypothetical protein ACRDQZ_05450 [Mycobacteriales bacterium]
MQREVLNEVAIGRGFVFGFGCGLRTRRADPLPLPDAEAAQPVVAPVVDVAVALEPGLKRKLLARLDGAKADFRDIVNPVVFNGWVESGLLTSYRGCRDVNFNVHEWSDGWDYDVIPRRTYLRKRKFELEDMLRRFYPDLEIPGPFAA